MSAKDQTKFNFEINPGGLMLDDLSVGQKFLSAEYKLEEPELVEFASKYDPQAFHTNAESAKNSFFEGLAASGWQTASITMSLFVGSFPIAGGLIGAGADLTWTRPVRPGDTLKVETEVMEIKPSRSRPERGMVTVRSVTSNQAGETVQILVSRVIVPRKL